MNITKESTGDLTALLKVEIVKDDYENEVTGALKEYQRKSNIPGFRPGKVPFGMIKKMYGNAVMADKINNILSESISGYIKDNNIKILGNPLPNSDKTQAMDFQSQTEFDFYFDIGLAPDFSVDISDNIEVDYYIIKVDDKMIDNFLSDMQKRHGEAFNPEQSEVGDRIFGEFAEVDDKGNLIENGISHKASILPEFVKLEDVRKMLTGLSKDDKIIFNPLKATESPAETASLLNIKKEEAEKLQSDFQFTVEEISRIKPAKLDEDFFNKIYPGKDIKTEKDMRKEIKSEAEQAYLKESDKIFMNEAIKKLIEISDISLPDDFLKRWLKENNEDQITEEQIDIQYDSFARSMKWHLIESKLVEEFDIEVKNEDVKSEIRNYFTSQLPMAMQDNEDERLTGLVNSIMGNKEEVKKISDKLFDDKLLKLFKSELKLKEKEVSYEDFIKIASEN